ncbi:hypothetical protein [Sulfobacillus harzensis]|uniref:Uncharacterized protein n=1 Tax=Sulfobacillus harzensis TaxID=2729629 RepID=A0A7Y0L559_9FIRM|nr:hypothetical protein [Sulfobacillus harzensis]NMP23410.1 hypothetical protein [Sulfobacillus harzensis]
MKTVVLTVEEYLDVPMSHEERRTVRNALAYWSQHLMTQGLGASAEGRAERARVAALLDRIPR